MRPTKKFNPSALSWEALNTLVAGGQDVEYLTNAAIQGFKKGEQVSEKLEEAKECDVHLAQLTTELQRRKAAHLVADSKALKTAVKGVATRISRLATIRAFLLTKQSSLSDRRALISTAQTGAADDEDSSPSPLQGGAGARVKNTSAVGCGTGDEPSSSATPARAGATPSSSKTDKEMLTKVCIFEFFFFVVVVPDVFSSPGGS